MPIQLPPCPETLRSVQFYLKTALEHDERDPVVSYWCRLWALQCALKIDKKSDEAKIFLMALMDWLEQTKMRMADNEAISNEVAAQAHIENYALKLFLWADGQDRSAVFNKNVVKSFFTAGILMDVLAVFGEQSEEIVANCKYAKWKAAYIHNCLKNGETPVPGPLKEEGSDDSNFLNNDQPGTSQTNSNPVIGFQFNSPGLNLPDPPKTLNIGGNFPVQPAPSFPSATQPNQDFTPSPYSNYNVTPSETPGTNEECASSANLIAKATGKPLEPEQITKAQKYCKWAISALNYDDIAEAVTNIQKALRLLETGEEV